MSLARRIRLTSSATMAVVSLLALPSVAQDKPEKPEEKIVVSGPRPATPMPGATAD